MNDNAKVDSYKESVCDLCGLLKFVLKKPAEFASITELAKSFKSQGALASLEYGYTDSEVTFKIRPMSLNKLKKTAEELLVGGYAELEKLRSDALLSMRELNSKGVKGNKRTKVGIATLNCELEKELESMRVANFRLLQAIIHSLSCFKNICDADDEKVRIKRTRDSEEAIRAILSMNFPGMLRKDDFSAVSNVVDFKK